MLLYHGTSEEALKQILSQGLLPRNSSGSDGNWPDHPSEPDRIYMSSVYAPYFAYSASPDFGDRWAIVEIDTDSLDQERLAPDEDFLEQASRGHMFPAEWGAPLMVGDPDTGTMASRTKWLRDNIDMFSHHWEDSVHGIGNCSYRGEVPLKAITKAVLYDPKANPSVTMMALDPMITISNYRLCSEKYLALMDWLFDREFDVEAITGQTARLNVLQDLRKILENAPEKARESVERQIEIREEMLESLKGLEESLRNRSGVEFVDLPTNNV